MNKIKKIDIHAFRGIPNLELIIGGKNLAVRGENATGKSSIVEAFEFFFTGSLSIFEGEGTQTLSLIKHTPHKNFTKDDVSVKITFDPGDIVLERTFQTTPEPPPQLERYFETAQKGTFVLRRSQILKFIMSQPADRFRAIASIIGTEKLDNIELAMKRAHEDMESSFLSKKGRIKETYDTISKELGLNVADLKQTLESVNLILTQAGLSSLTSFEKIGESSSEFLSGFKESADIENVMKLDELGENLKKFRLDSDITDFLGKLNSKLRHLKEGKFGKELFLRDFLLKGQEAIEYYEKNFCPLCGQEIDKERLLEQVKNRLQTLLELSSEATEIRQMSQLAENKVNELVSYLTNVSANMEMLKLLSEDRANLSKVTQNISDFKAVLLSIKELKTDEGIALEEFEKNLATTSALIESIGSKCGELLKASGIPDEWKKRLDAINLANRVAILVSEITNNEKNLPIEQKRVELAKKLYEIFSETKKEKTREIYNSIRDNVNLYYSTLHPDDPHKNIEINVVESRRASAQLRMESFGLVEDPRAYISEGHLDSLGLCIFLAFVKKFNQECPLVILDDVVTTVDSQHRGLICKLLIEDFGDYQLLITTHDAIWYDEICAAQKAYGVDGNYRNIDIVKWTIENGPQIEPYKPRWESILGRIDWETNRALQVKVVFTWNG